MTDRDSIRAKASFRTANLLKDFSMLGQFDIILCRNMAIYFSEQDKADLFVRLTKSLAPNGYLLLGSTEVLPGNSTAFAPKRHLRSVYYRRA
jgi:chemotaxis protein methyltransferase CheR